MPKTNASGQPSYYGHEGIVTNARDEKFQVDAVSTDAEVHPIGEPGQDLQEAYAERNDAAKRNERHAAADSEQVQRDRESNEDNAADRTAGADVQEKDAKGGELRSAGNSSKESSTLRGSTSNKK